MVVAVVPGFLPSTSGLHFDNNNWPSVPDWYVPVPGGLSVGIGDASNGLCGGMVFTVRDIFESGLTPPPDTTKPMGRSAFFRYIAGRLLDSFNISGGGVQQWLSWQLPTRNQYKDTLETQWPRVMALLRQHTLVPLGLVKTKSFWPGDLGLNHQVLAYGFERDEASGRCSVRIYDPNFADADDVVLTFTDWNPDGESDLRQSTGGSQVFGFFVLDYSFSWPGPAINEAWENLGGRAASAPATTSWGEGRLDLFVTLEDNSVAHRWFDETRWHDWEPRGGRIASAPTAACWAHGRLDLFGTGTDGSLQHCYFADGRWRAWESLGGHLVGGPAACSWGPNRLDVFGVGQDGTLQHRWYDHGWKDWESIGGIALVGTPTATSWGPERIDVFVLGSPTDLQAIQHRWYDHGWRGWETIRGRSALAPAVSSWGPQRLDLFYSEADLLAWRRFDGQWLDQQAAAGLMGGLHSAPAAVSWGAGRIDIFGTSRKGEVLHSWYDHGSWRAAGNGQPH